jgi:NADPH:quinone reductase-like Zn-dependent oxidoreductase
MNFYVFAPACLLRSRGIGLARSFAKSMKAMRLIGTGASRALQECDLPAPTPSDEEILIRVHATGVTPTELLWHPTNFTKEGKPRQDAVPGHEFSGVVEAVGDRAGGFYLGQAVYGVNDWFADGATAEFCLTTPSSIAPKPARLSHAEAATVPIGALTAWQGLMDRAAVSEGERVLIHGGAGAVGVFAIQLAKRAGAQVFTTASSRHREFLQQLGADHVIDYKTERFEEHLRDLDVIFDGVGGETLQRSWAVLKSDGRLVTVAAEGEDTKDDRTKAAFFIVEPKYAQLVEIAHLLDRGKLKTFVDATVPLQRAGEAYFGATERQHGYGKVVVEVIPDAH